MSLRLHVRLPRDKRYNEAIAFMVCVYFWAVFAVEPELRFRILQIATPSLGDGEFEGVIWSVVRVLLVLGYVVAACNIVLRPFFPSLRVDADRGMDVVTIVTINLASASVYTVRLWQESAGWMLVVPAVNGLIIALEYAEWSERDFEDEMTEGHATLWHALIGVAIMAALFWFFHLGVAPHWSASLSIGCVVAAAAGLALTRVLPLAPEAPPTQG